MDSKSPFTLRTFLCLSILVFLGHSFSAEAADLRGQVKLDGPVPEQERMTIEPKKGIHSTEGCGSLVKVSQRLLVDPSGGIKNAVVWLDLSGPEGKGPSVLVDQRQCVFEPHVIAVPAGQEIAIRNSDSAIHNVRIFKEGKPSMLMHQWQKADGADIRWRFPEAGRYVLRCGVHPWMYAWVFVAPSSRVAVTDETGRFMLAGVPEGRHTLHVWHETLGTRQVELEVGLEGSDLKPIRMVSPKDS